MAVPFVAALIGQARVLGSYLFHELTTPLGSRLERTRLRRGGLPFRSFGTFGVRFPRGLLLHLAARGACQRLLEQWQAEPFGKSEIRDPKSETPESISDSPAKSGFTAHDLLEAAQTRVLADPELEADSLANRILVLAGQQLEGSPRELLARLLAALEEQSQQMMAQDDPGAWARQALTRVRDWLGGGLQSSCTSTVGVQRKSRLTRALEDAAAQLAEGWDQRFNAASASLMDHPGRRIALAEAALQRFLRYCREATESQGQRLQRQTSQSQASQKRLQHVLDNCIEGGGGFSWFGGKSRRQLRVFVDHLAAFARQCLAEDTLEAVHQFYGFLHGRLADRLRDLAFCRQRLRHMQEALNDDERRSGSCPAESANPAAEAAASPPDCLTPAPSTQSFWESIRESAIARVVLPAPPLSPPNGGENKGDDLEQAAHRFLQTLTVEQWTQLDQAIQDHVLAARDGLQKALLSTTDLMRHLLTPLLSEAVSCLSAHLPLTDVAQVELAVEGRSEEQEGRHHDLSQRIHRYYRMAAPGLRPTRNKRRSGVYHTVAVGGDADESPIPRHDAGPADKDHAFLLVPASEAGRLYGEHAQRALPDLQLVNVPGQADLMFCRERAGLELDDLELILHASRAAYQEMVNSPPLSPHSRFDIQEWMPLDP